MHPNSHLLNHDFSIFMSCMKIEKVFRLKSFHAIYIILWVQLLRLVLLFSIIIFDSRILYKMKYDICIMYGK